MIHGLLLGQFGRPFRSNDTGNWNPADKSAAVTLTELNALAQSTAANGSVRAVQGRSSGHYYFESRKTLSSVYLIGLGNASATLANYPGVDANGWAYYGNDGQKYTNNVGTAYGTSAPAVVGVEYNSGTIIFWLDGVSQGNAFTGVTGTLYPMWGSGTSGAGTRDSRLNLGGSTFAYSTPAGAAPWNDG